MCVDVYWKFHPILRLKCAPDGFLILNKSFILKFLLLRFDPDGHPLICVRRILFF